MNGSGGNNDDSLRMLDGDAEGRARRDFILEVSALDIFAGVLRLADG